MSSLSREQLYQAYHRWWSLRDLLSAEEIRRRVGDYLLACIGTDAEAAVVLALFEHQFSDDPPRILPEEIVERFLAELLQ